VFLCSVNISTARRNRRRLARQPRQELTSLTLRVLRNMSIGSKEAAKQRRTVTRKSSEKLSKWLAMRPWLDLTRRSRRQLTRQQKPELIKRPTCRT